MKFILMILSCMFFICCTKENSAQGQGKQINNFRLQFYESVDGRCTNTLSRYVDNNNGNIIYITESCIGLSMQVMPHIEQK